MRKVECPYCSAQAKFVDSATVYHGRSYGMIWLCKPCWAYVGVHKGSDRPLGRLADEELRAAKIQAHTFFDPIWKDRIGGDGWTRQKSRSSAYKWLAEAMQIEGKDCHIGMFDVEQCQLVVDLCRPYHRSIIQSAY